MVTRFLSHLQRKRRSSSVIALLLTFMPRLARVRNRSVCLSCKQTRPLSQRILGRLFCGYHFSDYALTCTDSNHEVHREFWMDLTASSAVNLPITSASLGLEVVRMGVRSIRFTYSVMSVPPRFTFTTNFVVFIVCHCFSPSLRWTASVSSHQLACHEARGLCLSHPFSRISRPHIPPQRPSRPKPSEVLTFDVPRDCSRYIEHSDVGGISSG
jgi:hypothetical protein